MFVEYTYNAEGLRTKKNFGDEATNFIYNNGYIVLETDQDNRITAKNIWGSQLIARETETDEYHYLYNGHGDVASLLNEKGETVKDYRYDVYGNAEVDPVLALNGQLNVEQWRQETEKIDNPFRYCGEYLDDETGNYYLRARYYDPSIQRFINEDSYGVERGAAWQEHLYGYANNNPLRYVDPSGHIVATNDPAERGIRVGLGSRGNDVKLIQKVLNAHGYNLAVDGIFGKKTLAAVNNFKSKHRLRNTGSSYGVVGNLTYRYLLKIPVKKKTTVISPKGTRQSTSNNTGLIGINSGDDYDEQYDDLYDRNVKERGRSSDAKKRERRQIDDAWGKDRAAREEKSRELHDSKRGGRNDDNQSYNDLKDGNFRDKISEITGLTGGALTVYIIISEGSRFFPPRNLIPVP